MTLEEIYDAIEGAVLSGGRRTTASNLRIVLKDLADFTEAKTFDDSSLIKQNGNAFADNIIIGTLDNQNVIFIRNNTTYIGIYEQGTFLYGSAFVDYIKSINGTIAIGVGSGDSAVVIGKTGNALSLIGDVDINGSPIPTSTDIEDGVQEAKDYANALVVGLWDDRGNYDASTDLFPLSGGSGAAGAILKGDIWTVSVEGTDMFVGDTVRALIDTPGQTASNWAVSATNIGYVPENSVNKGEPDGYASLDESGKIPLGEIPIANSAAFNDVFIFNNIFGKFLGTFIQDEALDFSLGAGNVPGATIHFFLVADGENTIFFSDDFDYVYGFQNGEVLEAGTYEIYMLYKGNGKVSVNIPAGQGSVSSGGIIVLSSPENFEATGLDEDTISLSWDLVENASSYLIEYSLDEIAWSTLATPSDVTDQYDDTGLDPEETVYYRIKAIGDGVVYSDSSYSFANATSLSSTSALTWSTSTDMIVTGNDLESTSGAGTAQATEKLIGDGYVEFKISATPANSTGTVIALDEATGGSLWTVNEFAAYVYNGDVYSGLDGVSVVHGAIFGNELIRLHRVGTEMRWYTVASGVPTLRRTVTGVTTADLFIKAYIVVSGKSMFDCIMQNT